MVRNELITLQHTHVSTLLSLRPINKVHREECIRECFVNISHKQLLEGGFGLNSAPKASSWGEDFQHTPHAKD